MANTRRLVRAPRRRRRSRRPARARGCPRKEPQAFEASVAKARTKDSMQALAQAAPRPSTASSGSSATRRSSSPIEDVAAGHGADDSRSRPAHDPHVPAHAPARPAPPARELPLRRRRAQGRRRRQRRDPVLDPAAARPRRDRPAVPPGQGGAGVGARAVPRHERVRATTASAWSRVSG